MAESDHAISLCSCLRSPSVFHLWASMNLGLAVPAFAVIPAVLAVIFVAAGISKLRRPHHTLVAFEHFGVPTRFRNRTTGFGLPTAEIALGLALISTQGWLFVAAAGTVASAVAVFVFLTARALSRGERFDCGCFGATTSPISRPLVLRNVFLLLGAIGSTLLGLQGFDGVVPAVSTFDPTDWAWIAVALFLGTLAVLFAVTPQSTRINAGPGTRDGTTLSNLSFTTNTGEPVRLMETMGGRPHLIVMVRPRCAPCANLLEGSDSLRSDLGQGVGLLLAVVGDAATFTREHPDLAPVSLFAGHTLSPVLVVTAFPAAVLVDAHGLVITKPVAGAASIRRLANQASQLRARS